MRASTRQIIVCALALMASIPTAVRAECYGDAASMYGCGAPVNGARKIQRQGSLEHFGDTRAPVLPDISSAYDQSASDDVITQQERRRMMRSIILGNSRRNLSDRSFIQAINQSGRPVRRSGSVNQGGSGR